MATAADQIPVTRRLNATRIEYYVLIPHPTGTKVLLVPDGGEWTLPGWTHERGQLGLEWHDVSIVDRALRERFNLDGVTLRCLQADHERTNPIYDQGVTRYVYEAERPSSSWTPPAGGRWVGYDDLRRIRVAVRGHLGILGRWLDEADDPEALAQRPPWYRPGWHEEATAWIDNQLARRGLTAIVRPERIRLRERSAEMRIETTGGRVRFKTVPAPFAHELPLTDYLAKIFPGQVPQVLARDDTRRRMLMTDYRDAGLEDVQDVERWVQAIRRYAELQVASIPRVPELRRRGVPSRPVRELPGKIDALLADTEARSTAPAPTPNGAPIEPLRESELDQLHALAPVLASFCRDLGRARSIPEALNHGNPWPDYFDGDVLSDWSDAFVGHPFFNVTPFLVITAHTFRDPDIEARLRDAYLAPWARYAPQHELLRLFELAQRVEPLHYAVLYQWELLPRMDARWEKEWIPRFCLREVVTQHHREARARSTSRRQGAPSKQRTSPSPLPSQVPTLGGPGPSPAQPQGADDPDIDALNRLLST